MVEHDCWYYPEEKMPSLNMDEERKDDMDSMDGEMTGHLTYQHLSEHLDDEDELEYNQNPKSNCLLSYNDLTKDYLSSPPDYMKHIDKFY
mmetsp:Transcript_11579/g.8460  ORF Transcript_11579/g.8460 Transcript_11579/m.8460 type:complete len:90 (-) Transcript_11579:261-530(-)